MSEYTSYPKGPKSSIEQEDYGDIPSMIFRGMVFDDHAKKSSDEYWSQVCKKCLKENMPRLVGGVHEIDEDCKEDIFKCGIYSCDQPAEYYLDIPYEEMFPTEVEKPDNEISKA